MNISKNRLAVKFAVFIFIIATMSPAAPAQDDKPEDVIRVNTDLIQTDVTVVDKTGKFVEGLRADQFQLKIEGKPAGIDFFEQVNAYRDGGKKSDDAASPQTAQPADGISLRDRKVIFFLDDLHLSLSSLSRSKMAINHFIDSDMMPRDSVAIITASGQLGFLQQFTSNKAVLRAALARLRQMPNTSRDTEVPPMPEYVAVRILNNDRQAAAFYVEKLAEGMKTKSVSINMNALFETVKQRANMIVGSMAATTKNTLSTLENFLNIANRYEGRKIVFLLSDGFYLESKNTTYTTTDGLQRAIHLATQSGSSIYTIDARGLFSILGGDAAGERPSDPNGRLDKSRVGEEMASREGLATLANMTGGRFIKNQNYFEKWVDGVLAENAGYYVLAWSPEKEEHLSRKFKSIEVEVIGRPDLTVRQQRGYLTSYTKPEPKGAKDKKDTAKADDTQIDTGKIAVRNAAPKKQIPTEISLSYLDVPNVGGVLTTAVQVDAEEFNYGEKKDQEAVLDMAGVIYDIDGKQAGTFKTGISTKPAQNVVYSAKNPLKPGLYQVQVGVKEAKTGRIGTAMEWIEIPDLAKNDLTMGSLFLGGRSAGSAEKSQVQFSVDHRFNRPVRLDFTSFVYNAARAGGSGGGGVDLTTQIEVIDKNGRKIVTSPLRPLAASADSDMARIIVQGAIPAQYLNAPGSYLLRLTVADNKAKTRAVQEAVFVIE